MSEVQNKLKPVGEYILVKPLEEDVQKTPSGLLIQNTKSERPQMGVVLAVGNGKLEDGQLVKPEFNVGDTVIFKKYSPDEFEIDGQKVLVMKFTDVIAIYDSSSK